MPSGVFCTLIKALTVRGVQDPNQRLIAFVGDTHGDTSAIAMAFRTAAHNHAAWLVSVGDLWWRPQSLSHSVVAEAISDASERYQVSLLLVDGNNDDAVALLGNADSARPRQVTGRFWYAPRGSRWEWGGRRFTALGGARTFRTDGKTLGVDLFDGEGIQEDDVERAIAGGATDVLVCHDAPDAALLPMKTQPGPDSDNRDLVRRVVAATRPELVVHGHYHRPYEGYLADHRVVGLGREHNGVPDVRILNLRDLALSPAVLAQTSGLDTL